MSDSNPLEGINLDILRDFTSSPQGFVLGLILTPLLDGLEDLVVEVLGLVNLLFFGTSEATTGETLGVADVPVVLLTLLVEAGTLIGTPILRYTGFFARGAVDFVAGLGPFVLLGVALVLVVIVNVYAGAIRKALELALDVIPSGGAILE